jgi:hypothetical protein
MRESEDDSLKYPSPHRTRARSLRDIPRNLKGHVQLHQTLQSLHLRLTFHRRTNSLVLPPPTLFR